MRRILRENLWMMAIIVAFVLVVVFAKVGWGQEKPRQPTPEQQIALATKGMLSWKMQYGREVVFAAEMQQLAVRLERQVGVLKLRVEKLKKELKMIEDKVKDEKVPNTDTID